MATPHVRQRQLKLQVDKAQAAYHDYVTRQKFRNLTPEEWEYQREENNILKKMAELKDEHNMTDDEWEGYLLALYHLKVDQDRTVRLANCFHTPHKRDRNHYGDLRFE